MTSSCLQLFNNKAIADDNTDESRFTTVKLTRIINQFKVFQCKDIWNKQNFITTLFDADNSAEMHYERF